MGEDICNRVELKCEVVGEKIERLTTASDTIAQAKLLLEKDIDLLVFAGGDGTARNICEAVEFKVPVVGIPTGCKIHSGVYAINPRMAGELINKFVEGKISAVKDAEVMDINEELFRKGIADAKLY